MHSECGFSKGKNIVSDMALGLFVEAVTPIVNNAISACAVSTCGLTVRKTPNRSILVDDLARIGRIPQIGLEYVG
jgi:hypothetical protein